MIFKHLCKNNEKETMNFDRKNFHKKKKKIETKNFISKIFNEGA